MTGDRHQTTHTFDELYVHDISQSLGFPGLSVDTAYLPGVDGVCSNWEIVNGTLYIGFSSEGQTTRLKVTTEAFEPVLDFLVNAFAGVDIKPVEADDEPEMTQEEINDLQDEVNEAILHLTTKLTERVIDLTSRVEALETPPVVEEPATKASYPEWTSDMRIYHEGDRVTMDGVDYVAAMDCEPNRGDKWYGNHISCWKVVID